MMAIGHETGAMDCDEPQVSLEAFVSVFVKVILLLMRLRAHRSVIPFSPFSALVIGSCFTSPAQMKKPAERGKVS
jgi:hypothetical protein